MWTHRTEEGNYWGHSEALNLTLCWEEGHLRFWGPVSRNYLPTFEEERDAHDSESAARQAAEACVQQLEEELRRQSS